MPDITGWLGSWFPQSPALDTPAAPIVVQQPVAAASSSTVFDTCYKLLLTHEGGFGKDPDDSGNWTSGRCGEGQCLGTKYGVDTASYPSALSKMPPADRATMPALVENLTVDQAEVFYKYAYWQEVRADELPGEISMALFDSGVNSGCGRAVEWLQGAVGVPADGGFGPVTMGAVQAKIATVGAMAVANAVLDTRLAFDQSLSTFSKYGRGWTARIADIRTHLPTVSAS